MANTRKVAAPIKNDDNFALYFFFPAIIHAIGKPIDRIVENTSPIIAIVETA